MNGVFLRREPIHQDIARRRGSSGHPRAGGVANTDGICVEAFLIRLNGIVDRRVDHGKVQQRRRPGWTSTGKDGSAAIAFNSVIGSAAVGAAPIRQPQRMRPVNLRSLVMESLLREFPFCPSALT